MRKLKYFFRNGLQVAPFILSTTITFVPYLLFLGLNNHVVTETIIPFVLFYTFRMTGVFLLKSFKLSLTSFNILILSILMGGTGCLVGVMGLFYFPAYLLSAVLLGISASWFPVANATVDYHEKQQGYSALTGKKYVFLILIFTGLVFSLLQPLAIKIPLVLAEYTLLYVAAYHTVSHYPTYEIDFNEVDKRSISLKELSLFLSFFVLLILIRSARLLFDIRLLNLGIILASGLFLATAWAVSHQKKKWYLPSWLNVLTFANGMCTNFILLFGAMYISLDFGTGQLMTYLYIPYIIGILFSGLFSQLLARLFVGIEPITTHILGLVGAFFLLLLPAFFPAGVLLLSCCLNGLSELLNQAYFRCTSLKKDQRLLAKYSTQTKGSITHQLLLMSSLWLLVKEKGLSVETVFQLTSHQIQNTAAQQLIKIVHITSVIGFIMLFLIILFLFLKRNSSKSSS